MRMLEKSRYFRASGCPIDVFRIRNHEDSTEHAHEFSEIVVVLGGSGIHFTGGEEYPITAGDVFVLTGTRAHGYRACRKLHLVNILYDPARLRMPEKELRTVAGYHVLFSLEPAYRKRHNFNSRLQLSTEELERVARWIERMEQEMESRQEGFSFAMTALFMQIVLFLSRCCGQPRNTDARALLRIGQAISFLDANFTQDVSLEQLAAIAHLSSRSFLRIFRQATGYTPIQYLLRRRIARATELLRHNQYNITEVAHQTGFHDSNYFSRQFTSIMGLSPRSFLKKQNV